MSVDNIDAVSRIAERVEVFLILHESVPLNCLRVPVKVASVSEYGMIKNNPPRFAQRDPLLIDSSKLGLKDSNFFVERRLGNLRCGFCLMPHLLRFSGLRAPLFRNLEEFSWGRFGFERASAGAAFSVGAEEAVSTPAVVSAGDPSDCRRCAGALKPCRCCFLRRL